jgi:hypothetical protein
MWAVVLKAGHNHGSRGTDAVVNVVERCTY